MANLKQIQTKIKSVTNLTKITRALEVVSTIKLQKSKDRAENLRKYLIDLLSILGCIGDRLNLFKPKLRPTNKRLAVVISTDRGLCGAINSKLFRAVHDNYKKDISDTDVFVVGKKGLDFFGRGGYNIVGSLTIKDDFHDADLVVLYDYIKIALEQRKYKEIDIYFNLFKNSLIQIPTGIKLFPLDKNILDQFLKDIEMGNKCNLDISKKELIIEPNISEFIKEVYRQIRSYIIFSAIVQNKAGEHASRMIAMKNAKDNSNQIISSLTLSFNKARQASVTQEISEIVSAKLALED